MIAWLTRDLVVYITQNSIIILTKPTVVSHSKVQFDEKTKGSSLSYMSTDQPAP